MKKTLLISMVTAALVCVFALPSLYAVDAPGDMVLKAPAGAKMTKSPVAFSHKGHTALDCAKCHHKWDGKGEIKNCSVEGCHADTSKEGKKKPTSFYSAFHAKADTSCVGCHKAMKKAKKATGPTKCGDCHPKKK
ncbi:cytochrome c3 family protein [Maridesulfovibrio sp.]|uniref:cytochrome c3 family protein n=1 Tax=Maridesulfovibrio sp. TaxID=2795000 RepID=UPI0029C9B772|nr:cytochrome c3 family protein [Maridesulfovibrio sp.]